MSKRTYNSPTPQFYAKEDTGELDADGMPMFGGGLWCSVCEVAYGLSKLKEIEGKEDFLLAKHNLEVMLSL